MQDYGLRSTKVLLYIEKLTKFLPFHQEVKSVSLLFAYGLCDWL